MPSATSPSQSPGAAIQVVHERFRRELSRLAHARLPGGQAERRSRRARLLETAPRLGGIPILLNIPAFAIVMLVTWVLLLGVRESARANNIMVVVKLLVLGLFVGRRGDARRHRPITCPSRRTAGPASTRARPSSSSRTSASTRSRRRRRRPAIRSAICPSASWAAWLSAR